VKQRQITSKTKSDKYWNFKHHCSFRGIQLYTCTSLYVLTEKTVLYFTHLTINNLMISLHCRTLISLVHCLWLRHVKVLVLKCRVSIFVFTKSLGLGKFFEVLVLKSLILFTSLQEAFYSFDSVKTGDQADMQHCKCEQTKLLRRFDITSGIITTYVLCKIFFIV